MKVDETKILKLLGDGVEEIMYNGDWYTRCQTFDDVEQWAKEEGWQDVGEFEESTHVNTQYLLGKWFIVLHNRVFVGSENELPTGHLSE